MAHLDAAGHPVDVTDAADRVGERRDLPQPLQHAVNARWREFQPIEKRRSKAAFTTAGKVLRIGLRQRGTRAVQRIAGCQQRRIALCGT